MQEIGVGRQIDSLPAGLDWTQTAFVVVSGASTNPCGHALLFIGGGYGHYFHVPGIPKWFERPFYLSGAEYATYLSQNHRKEIGRRRIAIPCPPAAESKLAQLMAAKWRYGVLPSNCVSFVQAVAKAGGNFWDLANCPRMEPIHWEWLVKKVQPHFEAKECAYTPPLQVT